MGEAQFYLKTEDHMAKKTAEPITEQEATTETTEVEVEAEPKAKKKKPKKEAVQAEVAAEAEHSKIELTGRKVECFVSKKQIDEALATEMPYLNGQKVWVTKALIKVA